MSQSTSSPRDVAAVPRVLQSVQLVGFSSRDRELLRLFLRRPPRAGPSLNIVEDDSEADMLIGNAITQDTLDQLRQWSKTRPAIGIVERFERDAPFYQVAQDSQMLFSLAQAINRIRAGWVPPVPSDEPAAVAEVVEPPAAPAEEVVETRPDEPIPAVAVSEPVVRLEPEEQTPAPVAPPEAVPAKAVNTNPAAAASVIAVSAGLPWQRALNILVIDDSHFSRVAISEALIKVGFAVDMADGGEEGLRLAAAKVFDVALVDFEMPGMRGPEVLRKLRALGTQAPSVLIMLTSRTGSVDRLRAKFAGCDAYLTKPTKMAEFLSTLRGFAIAGKLSRS